MHNVIMRTITLTADYQPLAAEKTICSVEISCPPDNAGDVVFLGDLGQEVAWVPGEWHGFQSVDLAAIRVKGTPWDVVTIVGGTW